MRNAGLRPKKRLGQNFLVDPRVLDAIVEAAELSPEDLVLEIGAGIGTLTQQLALSSGRVIAVELDEGLFHILQSICQDRSNVTLIHADILNLDLGSPSTRKILGLGDPRSSDWATRDLRIKVVGNLPYYITTPILMKVLDLVSDEGGEASSDRAARDPRTRRPGIQMVLVMVQEEVGARIVASPGTKDYGALSIAIAYRSDAEILKRVPADSFYPQPKVDSVLVRLNVRSAPPIEVKDERLFFQIVRAAFQYRRKTLRNALLLASRSGGIQLSIGARHAVPLLDSALQTLNLDPKRRGETLSSAEFAALANMIVDYG